MITLGFWRATFFATLGVSPLVACSSSSSGTNRDDAGTGDSTGGATATGGVGNAAGSSSGGQGTASTGGSVGAGGFSSTGGAGGTGAASSVCKNPTPRLDFNGKPTGFIDCAGGFSHRPDKGSCPTHLPRAASCGSGAPVNDAGLHAGECTKDSDCKDQSNGYCQANNFGPINSCSCNYGCTADADCGQGEICGCSDPIGQCIEAECASDSECGPGFLCISSRDSGCGYTFGCQTAKDTCVTDADCGKDGGASSCQFITDHHECGFVHLCGTGRPFLVGGAARVAPLATGTDWQSTLRPAIAELNAEDRSIVAQRWTEIALMEHASIAAFARFMLELMSLGAPPELLTATEAAMADETVHARDAFALASTYAGTALRPGPLDVQRALASASPLEIVRTAILEGCIGETVAAVEAAEALAHATDPAVCAALSRVSPDETKHAELAWRFVQWVLASGPEHLRETVARELIAVIDAERAATEASVAASRPVLLDAALLEHGVLDEGTRLEIRRRVLVEIIEPCARALVRPTGARSPVARTPSTTCTA